MPTSEAYTIGSNEFDNIFENNLCFIPYNFGLNKGFIRIF